MAGTGSFIVNDKELEVYFPRLGDATDIIKAFEIANQGEKNYDVTVKVAGGGITGQRDAVKLGLARALVKMDEELRPLLRHSGYLTRDPRVKERKKPGTQTCPQGSDLYKTLKYNRFLFWNWGMSLVQVDSSGEWKIPAQASKIKKDYDRDVA